MNGKDRRLIVITGPTASGKSALAVDMASRLGTEIISADSRQVYRGMPIVTAVPTPGERVGIPHHLMECLDLEEYFSASLFEQEALSIAEGIWSRGIRDVVVCGGSMMYVDALCYGIDPLPTVPDSIRNALKEEWAEYGNRWLLTELEKLDPAYHASVDRANLKRVFHAVEVSRTAGAPYSSLCTGRKAERPFTIERHVIEMPREQLFARINARVVRMVETGLVEEARALYPRRDLNSLNTVGLKELFAHFDGLMTLDEAIARIAKNTRVYAKKQLTWLKRGNSQ